MFSSASQNHHTNSGMNAPGGYFMIERIGVPSMPSSPRAQELREQEVHYEQKHNPMLS